MNHEQAERMILDIYRARSGGDPVGMTANCHDEATYRMNANPIEIAPSLRRSKGKQALIDTFAALAKAFKFEDDWKVVRFIHDGDASVLIWHGTVTSNITNKSHYFEVCDVIIFKDGKILSITQHTDTVAVAEISVAN